MSPSFAEFYEVDRHHTDTILLGDHAHWSSVKKYGYYLRVIQFCAPVGGSPANALWTCSRTVCAAMGHSALRAHISDVVRVSAKKKMLWVYAWTVIAMMENAKSIRNWAIFGLPRKTVRFVYSFRESDLSVPVAKGTSPNSASGNWVCVTSTFKRVYCGLLAVRLFSHRVSNKTVDVSPVSRVLARRWLQPVFPASSL